MARRETPGASFISLVPAVEIKAILYRRYSRNSLTQLPAFFLLGGWKLTFILLFFSLPHHVTQSQTRPKVSSQSQTTFLFFFFRWGWKFFPKGNKLKFSNLLTAVDGDVVVVVLEKFFGKKCLRHRRLDWVPKVGPSGSPWENPTANSGVGNFVRPRCWVSVSIESAKFFFWSFSLCNTPLIDITFLLLSWWRFSATVFGLGWRPKWFINLVFVVKRRVFFFFASARKLLIEANVMQTIYHGNVVTIAGMMKWLLGENLRSRHLAILIEPKCTLNT